MPKYLRARMKDEKENGGGDFLDNLAEEEKEGFAWLARQILQAGFAWLTTCMCLITLC